MHAKCSDSHLAGWYSPSREVEFENCVDTVEDGRNSAFETIKDQGRVPRGA